MTKELICVYQDCVMCGDRGKKLKQIIETNNLQVRKVSFASDEGNNLIHTAIFEHNISTMPFFTDGKKFSTKIEDFNGQSTKKVPVITKKSKSVKTGGKGNKK